MNRVVLMGRLTKDPDIRYSQSENPVCIARYSLAVDRNRKLEGQPTADFIQCIVFGKPAEWAEKYLKKGMKICVSGRIQTGSYVNKDVVKVYTTDVVCDDQEFCESKRDDSRNSYDDQMAQAAYTGGYNSQEEQQGQQASNESTGWEFVPDGIDEELPFA